MVKVLFICHGNICRSTMAEFYMKHIVNKAGLTDSIYIESAATSREEIGNDTHYGSKQKLDEMVLLQVDMTRNSSDNDAIMQRFQILGLPTILFFDEQGQEISQMRITGFLDAEKFLDWIK